MNIKKLIPIAGVILVILLITLSIQAFAKNRNNPPVIAEPQWDSPETRQLAERACFDCHSNQTKWPLYSGLPIVGQLIQEHVIDARKELNFSEWGVAGRKQEGDEAAEKVFEPMHYAENDTLPQPPYSWLHPKARLSQTERDQLAQGLAASLGGNIGEDNEITNQASDDDDD